jgi:hypothetical protein
MLSPEGELALPSFEGANHSFGVSFIFFQTHLFEVLAWQTCLQQRLEPHTSLATRAATEVMFRMIL